MTNQFSIHTPSNEKPEDLENRFVQRHTLLKRAVAWSAESLTTSKKNHLLFVGPRGSGKTHMVSMIVNRLRDKEELKDKMLIVWLGEDDIVTNFLDLVLSILRYLAKEYDFSLDCLAEAKGLKSDRAATIMLECITKQLNGRKILLIKENLSDVFNGLKDMGQKQFRAYLQEQQNMVVLGTSQQLFKGVSSRDAVFFGFFDIHYLKPLSIDDAIELIEKVSTLNGDEELRKFVRTPQGRYRVRAIHHLAGGNQRLYMELLTFLTAQSLNDLDSALDKLADDLTPYFQERIKSLAPQQGLIVQKLCEIEGAISVKDLAEEMFIGERSVAKQLGDLREKGYVLAHKRGKQTYYEISEPLMRLSLQVKHTHGKPLKILVLLLRAWFSDDELKNKSSDNSLDTYAKEALAVDNSIIATLAKKILDNIGNEEDGLRQEQLYSELNTIQSKEIEVLFIKVKAILKMIKNNSFNHLPKSTLGEIDDSLSDTKNTLLNINMRGKREEYNEAIQEIHTIIDYQYYLLGIAYYEQSLYEDSIKSLTVTLNSDYIDFTIIGKERILHKRAKAFAKIEKIELAIEDYYAIIQSVTVNQADKVDAMFLIIPLLGMYGKIEEAYMYASRLLRIDDLPAWQKFSTQSIYARLLRDKKEYKEAINILENIVTTKEANRKIIEEAYFLLTEVYYLTNNPEKARKALKKIFEYTQNESRMIEIFGMNNILAALARIPENKWSKEIDFLLKLFKNNQKLEYLSASLIRSVELFISDELLFQKLKRWSEIWSIKSKKLIQIQPAIKVLWASLLAIETKSDKPLFELPKEIRELVLPMIESAIKE